MNKNTLLDKLDKVTSRAASIAIDKCYPLRVTNKITLVGGATVVKDINGLYSIITQTRQTVYRDISAYDIAVIIAQRYSAGEIGIIRKVLALEEQFSKYHTDMMHYLNCLRSAQKRHDIERMTILEDKFQMAEILAKKIRNSMLIFKRIK